MRLWFSIESATQIRFRPTLDREGWLRGLHFEGAMLTIYAEETRYVCQRARPEEIPDWFPGALAKALDKMGTATASDLGTQSDEDQP